MKKLILLFAVALALHPLLLPAQFDLFSTKNKQSKGPMNIKSDAMDFDMVSKKATFMGNVILDHPQIHITCRKMIVYFTTEEKAKTQNAGDKKNKPSRDNKARPQKGIEGKTKLSHVECVDDVVITEKNASQKDKDQRALAGRAVFVPKKSTVTLTINPILIQGDSRLKGERITLHTDTSRVEVIGGQIISNDLGDSIQ